MLYILKCKRDRICVLSAILILLLLLGRLKGSYRLKNTVSGTERSNKLHRFSKYWLNKFGVPREIPPSSWCNENGVVVSIPVSNSIIKLLNDKVKKIYNKEIPIITEDYLDEESELSEGIETKKNELLTSRGVKISCNGTVLVAKSFYEIGEYSNERSRDSLIIHLEYSSDCNLVYEYSTEKYKYRVYKIDPFDRFLWKEQSDKEKEIIKLRRNKLNGKNVRTTNKDWESKEMTGDKEGENEDDLFWEFDLPSKLSIIVVCICSSETNIQQNNVCYPNIKWYKTVKARLIESEMNKSDSRNKKYLTQNELRDATMYGMLLSTIFTAGVDNNINVPNDEEEHIFDNKLDIKRNSMNDLEYFSRIYLWPSYCEYNRIMEFGSDGGNKALILNGCPVSDVKMTVLLNRAGHLIFSISNKNWNLVNERTNNARISLKCMVKLHNVPQNSDVLDCSNRIHVGNSSQSNKGLSWNENIIKVSGKDEEVLGARSNEIWTRKRWDLYNDGSEPTHVLINNDYITNSKAGESFNLRRLIMLNEDDVGSSYKYFDSNLRRNEFSTPELNINGVRSQITGKSMMSTPRMGRESLTGGSGDKSYLLFNRQFENSKNVMNDGLDRNSELKASMKSTPGNLRSRSLPSEPVLRAVYQNVLWRDWLIRYAPLVGENGNFLRVGNNLGSGFIGESYVQEAAMLGLTYDKTILSFLSGKKIPQLGRFITFGYTDGLYGARVDRSTTLNAWGADIQARYFLTSTLAVLGLREYAQHITVRDISLSARHKFSQKDDVTLGQFSTEAIASYKTLFVDIATNVKNKSYGMAVGLRGYQFTVVRSFMNRTTDFLGNWGNGWQILLSSTSPTVNDPTIVTRAGVGRLGRSFVLAGAGIGKDMIPIVSFQTQLDDVGVIIEFSPAGKERLFAYGIEVNHFAYFWESIFSAERTPVPLVLGVEPKDLSNVVFGGH